MVFFIVSSIIFFFSYVGNRQTEEMEELNVKDVLFSVCRSKINRERLLSFKSSEERPQLSWFATLKDGLVPFVLPLLRIAAAFPKTRSETNPSLSSAKHSCEFCSFGWRLLSR